MISPSTDCSPERSWNPDTLRTQPKALEFVKTFFDAGKPVWRGSWPPEVGMERRCSCVTRRSVHHLRDLALINLPFPPGSPPRGLPEF
jgi:hypothetical protein